MKERLPMHAGDIVEYIRKENKSEEIMYGRFTIISTDAVMKTPNKDTVKAYIYAKNMGSTWYVMSKTEFINTFKLEGEELEEE